MTGYDAVVVGAGLGGLAAGAKLAKEGKKVLLVEQHKIVGGCATNFRRKNINFEVSLHEMNGLDYREGFVGRSLTDLGIFDNIEFVRVAEFYRYVNDRVDVTVPDDATKARASVTQAFPQDSGAVDSFFDDIDFVWKCVTEKKPDGLNKFSGRTVGEYLDALTSNEDLKLALTANIPYYSDDPYAMNLQFFIRAQSGYLKAGGHFIKGGSQRLSDYLAGVMTSMGGEIVLNHIVTEITTKDGKATGIKYVSKKSEETVEKEASANVVIADAAIPSVVNDLIPALKHTDYGMKVNSLSPAHSLSSLYLAFSKPLSALGYSNYSLFLDGDIESLKDFHAREKGGDYGKKRIAFVNYGAIDSQLNKDGTNVASIAMVDYLEAWDKLSTAVYKRKKGEVTRTVIKRLEKVVPGIWDVVSISELATPKTIERYTLNPHGCVLGYAPTLQQSDADVVNELPIGNLQLVSAWTGWTGFTGTIAVGYLGATNALKQM